jgi:polyisoprenoid-binding protein YceI
MRALRPGAPLAAAVTAALTAALAAPLAAQAPARPAANVVTASVAAGARAHTVDAAHSEINFTASSRLLDAHGFFGKWDADVRLDPDAFERSTVRMTIDAASINTRNERRDAHLKGADFFDVATYPTITFASTSIARTSPTTGRDHRRPHDARASRARCRCRDGQVLRGRARALPRARSRSSARTSASLRLEAEPIEDEVVVQFNMSVAEKTS